jgi:hypothetical protein
MKARRLQPHDLGDRLCCAALIATVFVGLAQMARLIGAIWQPV